METSLRYVVPVEIRSAGADDGPHLTGVLLQEGRAASVRAEVFAPLSVVWGEDGVAVLTEHRGAEVGRAIPSRHPNGEIRIRMPATPAVQSAFTSKKFLSIEFVSLSETRMASGIREIARAYVSAAAMVTDPEYTQAGIEVREREAQAALRDRDRRWREDVLL